MEPPALLAMTAWLHVMLAMRCMERPAPGALRPRQLLVRLLIHDLMQVSVTGRASIQVLVQHSPACKGRAWSLIARGHAAHANSCLGRSAALKGRAPR